MYFKKWRVIIGFKYNTNSILLTKATCVTLYLTSTSTPLGISLIFFFFEVRCVVQFIWNWREWLYVAWTVNPCTSLPDSLGNSFWIWMRRKGPWKKETDIWHVWDGNWLQFMFFCYVRKLLTQKLLYTISANIKIRMLNSIIYMKKAHTTNDSQILNPISTIVLSTY